MYGQTTAAIWMVGFSNTLNNEKLSRAIIAMSRTAKRDRDRKLLFDEAIIPLFFPGFRLLCILVHIFSSQKVKQE
jgi:hypothetical protein